ncbi:MAG TPA: translesion error-prone DNA polymerase V autoproteolytic subunit, partial [Brumimicrobium sp.]|nr:translesion error-prone DNA polymerase V autoproteolytic subunit [Brumimicrobium sp.]
KSLYSSSNLEFYTVNYKTELNLPFVDTGINAGFPSPADDFIELSIDLNRTLIKNKDTTFFAKVRGHSMKNAGINDGDLLVIDRSLEPRDNKIAICQIDGEFTVKRIKIEKDIIWLIAENEDFKSIKVTPENEFIIWGIVIHSIKSF